jgi:hypothetical protein
MPPTFTPLQLQLIDYIIALNEDEMPPPELAGYMCAFDLGFEPAKRFTLHTPAANEIMLYYNMKDNNYRWLDKPAFSEMCRKTADTLVGIADCILFLSENNYINAEYKEIRRAELSEEEKKYWRRYQDFTPPEIASLLFAVSIKPIPRLKLYHFWESSRQQKASGQ